MHIAGVVASVTTSFVSAVSRLQLSFSVGDSDHPLRFEVFPFATRSQDLESKPPPQQASRHKPISRHSEGSARITSEWPKAVQRTLCKDEVARRRLSDLLETEVILLCRPSLVSKLGTHFQLCSQGGTPHDQNHFCLDEVKTIQKEFVLEILDAMNPNFRGDLQDAYDLGSKAFAKYINNMCTGYNGPKPCITPSVLPNVARQDVAKLVKLFAQCQPRYLWEFGQMVKWYIKKCSPTRTVASEFWVGVIDHQRAFAVRVCRLYLLMRLQDAQNYIASLSRAQLVYLCTGVLPGGPAQSLDRNLEASHDSSQPCGC